VSDYLLIVSDIDLQFRIASHEDWPSIWSIFQEVVPTGDTYPYPPDIDETAAWEVWMKPGTDRRFTSVAEREGAVVATAYLKPNAPGLGDHVCNAGWMVSPSQAGQGIGRRFAEWVIDQARSLGFAAMQFNSVVATNCRAIDLWKSLGFEIVGTIPDAFRHAEQGPVAVHVMYRRL
jgi:L-amino acid N-acyltransferase YncA